MVSGFFYAGERLGCRIICLPFCVIFSARMALFVGAKFKKLAYGLFFYKFVIHTTVPIVDAKR